MTPEETTPLLAPSADEANTVAPKHDAIYERFSTGRKRVIVAMVSLCGLLPLFVGGSFMPSIPAISKDLHSTGSIVSLAVSLSVFGASIGTLFAASYSTFYGRRPIYLIGLPLLCVGSVGVATAQNINQLMIWRFLQALGSSPGLSVGAGVIGDIYKLEERGTAMGIFFAAVLLGPALAPFTGGVAAHYFSWRIMQLAFGVVGFIGFFVMVFFFPETSHPGSRGIEKWRTEHGYTSDRTKFVWINPLLVLKLLKSPNLLSVSLAGLGVLITDYVLLMPLAYTFGKQYNITNEALIGLCFAPLGLGNIIGAPLAGRVSDYIVVKWRKKRGGVWYPEDRLRGTLIGAGIFVPLSVLLSGLLTQFVPGTLGLTLNLICLFMNGLGVDLVLSPSAAYAVDIMHSRSAESMAANNGFRAFLMSIIISGILPMIDLIGVAATGALAALFAWFAFGLLWCTIRYGNEMRAWTNTIEYSTAETN